MASRMLEHSQVQVVGGHPKPGGLFAVKLRPPRSSAMTVPRPGLHETFERALASGSVVVSAPAGSGKTTLLADWAREQRPPRRVAWVTLGAPERDPLRFAEYALAALHTALGDQKHRVPRVPPASGGIDEHFLAVLAEELSSVTGEIVLVLDDFHHVLGSATERLLRRILRHPLGQVRLVVLSRREPTLGQTKLRLRGLLRELGPAELALTVDETADLLRLHGHDGLTEAQTMVLHQRTRGWATGLEAVIGSMDARVGEDPVEHALRGAQRIVANYLDAEVLHDQPPELLEFLRRTTTVADVCGDLADALTGAEGGAGTLSDLYRNRLFLEPDGPRSDERCTWYHWNPLVADVIRARLRDRQPRLAADLHLAAAQWYRSHGLPAEAVRHALAADDMDTASTVLAECWFSLAVAGQTDSVRSLLRVFDEERLTTDPELVLTSAFIALHDRDLPRASLLAQTSQEGAADLPRPRRFAVEVTGAAVRLRCAGLTGRPDSPDLYPSTLRLLDLMTHEHRPVTRAERRRRALLLYALGTFELSQWRYEEAADHLSDAMSEAAGLALHDLLPRIRAQLVTVEIFAGRLDLARSSAQDVIEAAHRGERPGSQGHAATHLAVAVVDLQRGDRESALESLALARVALHPADRVTDVRVRLVRHSALLLLGRADEAEEEREELHDAVAAWDAPSWVALMLALADADQLRAMGRLDGALRTLETAAALATDPLVHQVWCNAYAQALLDTGRAADARALLADTLAGGGDRPLEVQALVVDSLAAERLDLPDESFSSLTRAVRLSRRERILRPFLLRSSEVRPLLEALLETGTGYDEYVRELLARLPAPPETVDASEPVEPLTARELDVLRAMRGAATTNDHVAGQLYVSVNTLRSHIKQINRKLGTTSRSEAVARARRLGLI